MFRALSGAGLRFRSFTSPAGLEMPEGQGSHTLLPTRSFSILMATGMVCLAGSGEGQRCKLTKFSSEDKMIRQNKP